MKDEHLDHGFHLSIIPENSTWMCALHTVSIINVYYSHHSWFENIQSSGYLHSWLKMQRLIWATMFPTKEGTNIWNMISKYSTLRVNQA